MEVDPIYIPDKIAHETQNTTYPVVSTRAVKN